MQDGAYCVFKKPSTYWMSSFAVCCEATPLSIPGFCFSFVGQIMVVNSEPVPGPNYQVTLRALHDPGPLIPPPSVPQFPPLYMESTFKPKSQGDMLRVRDEGRKEWMDR